MRFLRSPVAGVGVVLYMCLTAVKSKTVVVSQTPAEMEVLVGDVARINCSYSSGDGDQMRIEWTRNSSARPLCHRMANKHSSGSRQSCTSGFNVTLDLSANSSSLIIYNVHLHDSGVYFCQLSVEIPPPTLTAKGEGTRLIVNARPRVWVRAEPVSTPTQGVRLTCTSLDFYPGPIQVSWFADGHQLTNGTETGPLSPNPDGSFSISSFLNLTLTAWGQGGDYTCQVNHSTLHKPITERAHASSTGHSRDKLLWIILASCGLTVLMAAVIGACSMSMKKEVRSIKSRAESVENVEPVRTEHLGNEHAVYHLLGQGCARES
ncbi:immunoglobulin lambda-1 light chain-like [Leucoraja erinacea]|uniref:immunoglobulin lambda-1 light chain-like n=1 Tax=Leucoraja erinaceus TaxID=7782 RepID=UPI002456D747|nr:immunoglobulin lambda-1 light chain-like [Leucoraja erinacea]XP_055500335.1 immunoglobulin lambda-1 light chain-like [Leucoraja erinacea]